MNEAAYEKQLLVQKIEANRQLLARDVESLTGALRPWRRMLDVGRDAAPHLRRLGGAVSGLVAARSAGLGLRQLGWLLPVAVPAALWLLGTVRRERDER